MSLSAQEKLRVAHRLDELGIDLIEAGFPSSNPKELELFELLAAERSTHAQIAAFGMTRRRDVARDEDPALRILADGFAPVCTLVGKTWSLHLEKVVKVDRDENLRMIDESVAFLVARRQARDLRRRALLRWLRRRPEYALGACAPPLRPGAETVSAATPTAARCRTRSRPRSRSSQALAGRAYSRDPLPRRRRMWRREHARRGAAGATHVQGTINGYGERCGNANLVTIIPNLQLKLGYECMTDDAAHVADRRPPTSSTSSSTSPPNPDQPYVGRNAFAHKGGMHVAGVTADPATFEHIDPASSATTGRCSISELSGKGTVHSRAADAGITVDDAAATRVIERVKELEHRGYHYEAADGSFELLLRKETGDYEPLFRLESLARDRREARRRPGRDRGDDQDLDRRRAVRPHGRGQRSRQRARPGAARGARRDPPASRGHRPRQLQGPHPRRDEGHRRRHAGAARRLRRRGGLGFDRRLGERDRGFVGGARRLARVRHAGRPAGHAATPRRAP